MLYLLRHGLTDWNAEHKLQGQSDIPLNDIGRQMAIDAGIRNKDINIDVCYASPLCRAYETAKLFLENAGKSVSIIRDDRLREMNFGIYEGTKDSFEIPDCPVNDFFFEPEIYQKVEGAESMEELLARTNEFYNEIIVPELDENKDVLVVGHGAMNCAMITGIYGRPVSDFWMSMTGNCQLIKITEDGVFAALEGDTFGIPNWPPKREDYRK